MTPVRIRYGNGVTLSATDKTSKNRGYTRKLRVNRIPDSIGMIAVNECLDYFRKALANPADAPLTPNAQLRVLGVHLPTLPLT